MKPTNQFGQYGAQSQYIPNQGPGGPGGFSQNPHQPKRLICRLENQERGIYATYLSQVDPEERGRIEGLTAANFLRRSGLPNDVLKQIWIIAAQGNDYLDKEAFYVALRLVAYAQNGIEVSAASIEKNIRVQPPKFEGSTQPVVATKKMTAQELADKMLAEALAERNENPPTQQPVRQGVNSGTPSMTQIETQSSTPTTTQQSQPQTQTQQVNQELPPPMEVDELSDDQIIDISDLLLKQYETIWENLDTQKKGIMTQLEARDILMKSNLHTMTLFRIWSLSDTGDKGSLDKADFILALHLIAMAKRGIPMPRILPRKFEKFLKEYKKKLPAKEVLIEKYMENLQEMQRQQAQAQVQSEPVQSQPSRMDSSFHSNTSNAMPSSNRNIFNYII